MTSEESALGDAVDKYDRANDLRDDGDDAAAFAILEDALASIEEAFSVEAAIARARFAITRAEIAARTRPLEEAIAIANNAVERARRVRREEPLVEASAFYMLGKAERPSLAHRHGATSFAKSLAIFRRLCGDASRYTADAAGALGTAHMKVAEWQHAINAIDIVLAHDPDGPDPIHLLHRAIARVRMGEASAAHRDLERWRAKPDRSLEEQVRAHQCAFRICAARADTAGAAAELARAYELAKSLSPDPARQASLLESSAWAFATAATPPWMLAAEVLIRRAAALAWSPAIGDTANQIATLWRYGVEEVFVQPTFAILEIEAALQVWDASAHYVPRAGHQKLQLCVAGAPTTIERLADEPWRTQCIERVFSAFHAEQFKANEPNFVSPVKSQVTRLAAQQLLSLMPSLRIPKWATTNTVIVGSLGEIEILGGGDFTALAERALGATGGARTQISPSSSIPLVPGS